jgi:hypothetical protein
MLLSVLSYHAIDGAYYALHCGSLAYPAFIDRQLVASWLCEYLIASAQSGDGDLSPYSLAILNGAVIEAELLLRLDLEILKSHAFHLLKIIKNVTPLFYNQKGNRILAVPQRAKIDSALSVGCPFVVAKINKVVLCWHKCVYLLGFINNKNKRKCVIYEQCREIQGCL